MENDSNNPNILVLATTLKSELTQRGIPFDNWDEEWTRIEHLYCRMSLSSSSTSCVECSNSCELLCQNGESNLSVEIGLWTECEYPYGFVIDKRLTGEQQAIISIIFLLATLFAVSAYYLIRAVFVDRRIKVDHSTTRPGEEIISGKMNFTELKLSSLLDVQRKEGESKRISSTCEKKVDPRMDAQKSCEKLDSANTVNSKDVYIPVLLSVK